MPEPMWSDVADRPAADAAVFGGMPADRAARTAARRAFVDMKALFMRAVQDLGDRKGQWLQEKVRLATDPPDLWLLRGPVLAALQRNDPPTRALRAELYRGLDRIFPGAFGLDSASMPLGPTRPPEPWEQRPARRSIDRAIRS